MTSKFKLLSFCTIIMLSLGAIIIYLKYSPQEHTWFPRCPIKTLTGLSCPSCGIQRAFHSLLHGQMTEALSYNYFFVLSIPYAGLALMAHILGEHQKYGGFKRMIESRLLAYTYVVLFFTWFIIRNILEI